MNAKTYLGNQFLADEKTKIYIPRKTRMATTYLAQQPMNTHTREVIIAPNNARVDSIEKKTIDLHSRLNDKHNEIQLLNTKLSDMKEYSTSTHSVLRENLLARDKEISALRSKIDEKEESIKSLVNHANSTSSAVSSINTDLTHKQAHIGAIHYSLAEKDNAINILKDKIRELEQGIDALSQDSSNLLAKSAQQDKPEVLYVGKEANLPKQPEPVSEGGVWKDAPLALSVHGGMVLHNIGYTTTSKGCLPLVWDMSTNRMLINTSGK